MHTLVPILAPDGSPATRPKLDWRLHVLQLCLGGKAQFGIQDARDALTASKRGTPAGDNGAEPARPGWVKLELDDALVRQLRREPDVADADLLLVVVPADLRRLLEDRSRVVQARPVTGARAPKEKP